MSRFTSALSVCLPFALCLACGGATDIDFQGVDGGETSGGASGSGGDAGAGGDAGSGGSADAGSVGGGPGTGGSGQGGGGNGGVAGTGQGGGGNGGDAGAPNGGAGGSPGGNGGVAGTGMGGGGNGGNGGSSMIQCSSPSECPVPGGLPVQVDACCTPQGTCGVSSSFIGGGQCIEGGQPGEKSTECMGFSQGGFTLSGCCKPDGTCGVLDTFLGLGCVDPSQFGAPGGGGTCTP